MRFPGFIGPSYTLRSKNVDCQRCVNLFPEMHELGTGKEKEVAALHGTPGLTLLLTLAGGALRGIYTASNGQIFAVGGNKLYRISAAWAATELGTLVSTGGVVSMADNGLNLVIVDGTDAGYVWTFLSSAFAAISDPDFLGADMVNFQDGYFIFNRRSTGQFYISGLNDVTFDALDFSTSEGNADPIVSILSNNRDLWLFNSKTTEVFYDSGNADFPFERNQGAFMEHGCAAKFSVAKMENTVFWLGQNESGAGVVYMARGYAPQRISTHAVEFAIQGYSDFSDAVAFCYQQDGHTFYVINFPTADTTWCFDSSTGLWHERAYTNSDGQLERHRANFHAFGNGVHIVGDYDNGKIYQLSSDVYTDNGDKITRMRTAPHLTGGLKRVFYNSFELDIETGVGIDGTGQGDDPQIMLDWSDDHGHSWSNEKWVSFGRLGARNQRPIWRRLGASRDRVFRVKITDPVKVVLIGAEFDAESGAA